MTSIRDKVEHVRSAGQSRDHGCHWPGCTEQVPPAKWGCTKHWFKLPKYLRNRIWKTYRVGQEIDQSPSREYIEVARAVQEWIAEYEASRAPLIHMALKCDHKWDGPEVRVGRGSSVSCSLCGCLAIDEDQKG